MNYNNSYISPIKCISDFFYSDVFIAKAFYIQELFPKFSDAKGYFIMLMKLLKLIT